MKKIYELIYWLIITNKLRIFTKSFQRKFMVNLLIVKVNNKYNDIYLTLKHCYIYFTYGYTINFTQVSNGIGNFQIYSINGDNLIEIQDTWIEINKPRETNLVVYYESIDEFLDDIVKVNATQYQKEQFKLLNI